ncbi:MAG: alpha/beta hydrolase [Dehalococcoidia bacterium]
MPNVQVNGIGLNYEAVGSGPPLLFLACTIDDSATKWVDHMERYASDYRVIIPDVRGLAGNARVADAEPSDWVADTAALLDALDIASVPVVAETLGSRIAVRLAVDHPGKVSALVLNGLIARSNPEGDAWRRQMFMPGTANPENIEQMRLFQGDTWAEAAEFYVKMHEKESFRTYFDLPAIAGDVRAPTLITRGDIDDAAHPIEHSTAVHAGVAASWLSVHPNTSFNVMTNHPEEFWSLVGRFLSETA